MSWFIRWDGLDGEMVVPGSDDPESVLHGQVFTVQPSPEVRSAANSPSSLWTRVRPGMDGAQVTAKKKSPTAKKAK